MGPQDKSVTGQQRFTPQDPATYHIAPSAPTPNWTPEQEADFQNGVRATPWFNDFKKKYDEEPDFDQPNGDFNYRAAWNAGVRPAFYPPDQSYHWEGAGKGPDGTEVSFKRQNHPTGWMEDYFQLTGGGDPTQPENLSPDRVSKMQELLKQRYGGDYKQPDSNIMATAPTEGKR